MLRSTAKVISEITNLAGMAYVSYISDAVIDNIKIVKLTPMSALAVVVTDRGVLKDAMLSTTDDLPEEYYRSASAFISNAFAGYSIGRICSDDGIVERITDEYRKVFDTIVEVLKNYMSEDKRNVVLEGSSKLLEQPEYSDVGKASGDSDIGLSVNIAPCKDEKGSPECAIVTANLTKNGVNIGKAGVIGPIRMDYSRIVSVLEYIEKTVDELPDGKSSRQKK